MRRNKILLWLGVAIVIGAAANWLAVPSLDSGAGVVQAAKSDSVEARKPDTRWAALPTREAIGKPAGELFFPHSWTPAAPAQTTLAARGGTRPAAPSMPYRVAGKVVAEGKPEIVLAKGDAVVSVREGDKLDDGYRVEAIRPDHVTLLYVPLGIREKLPIGSSFIIDEKFAAAAEESTPAQLRWEGPKQVKAGDPFSVALKLSSRQPLHAVPLELSYDAALLEPIAVRAGAFFADGQFSYRINAEGSILVGASGKESLAADADLVVVTFKPVRAGATAELRISSLLLQGAAGRPIVHHEPATFRTAIVR
jgi:hypothetical protein